MRSSDDAVRVIGPLQEDAVRDAWPKVEAYLAAALERDGWKQGVEDVLADVASGQSGFYVVQDFESGDILAAVVCDSVEYPRSTVLNIGLLGGRDLYRWAHLLGWFEAEAARLGCDTVRISGRPGWGRIFPDYHESHRVFERKVVV